MEEEYGQSKYDVAGWPRWTDAARWTDAIRRPSTGATRFVRSAAVSTRAVCTVAVSVRVVFAAICDAISAATAGSVGAIFLPPGYIHAIDTKVCSGIATISLAAAVGGFRAITALATIADIAATTTHATVTLVAASSTASPAAKRTV